MRGIPRPWPASIQSSCAATMSSGMIGSILERIVSKDKVRQESVVPAYCDMLL